MSADASELNQLTRELGSSAATAGVKAARVVAKTAFDVTATAQQLVPVDTSATKQSIHPTLENGGLVAEIGPTTAYAPYLEYGTSRMPPHAFMGPALDRHVAEFVDALSQIGGELG